MRAVVGGLKRLRRRAFFFSVRRWCSVAAGRRAQNGQPPSFESGPTPEYMLLFTLIEIAALQYSRLAKYPPKDAEFERLYRQLARRPDGRDGNPVFSYLQSAAGLYQSLPDVSRYEFDEVGGRLARSARRFSDGPASATYVTVLEHTLGKSGRADPGES